MTDANSLDLQGYLHRVGYSGSLKADLGLLVALHRAHSCTVPFENLDPMRGRPVRLDLPALQGKIVQERRGGYCFEHNTLFAAVLRTLGFQVSTLEARVRPIGSAGIRPRTHMTLRVDLESRPWLVDVGFGADGPLNPVPLDGTVSEQHIGAFRVVSEPDVLVLQLRWAGTWRDLYAFTLVPAHPIDFEVANHFTATHPASPFVNTLTVQIKTPQARHALRDRTYSVLNADGEEKAEIADEQVPALLRERFGLFIPDADVLRALSPRT